MTIVTKKT